MDDIDLNKESTENLIEYIRWKDDPEYFDIAKQAFRVFTFRFQLDLQKKCMIICKNWGYDDMIALGIAYATFEKILKYPTFDKNRAKEKEYDKAVKLYLYKIASNLLHNYHKELIEGKNPFKGDEEIIYEFPDIENTEYNKERKAVLQARYEHIKKALERLSPKHKIIYLTYKQYESELDDGFKLPRPLLKELRERLDLTQNTIRSYRHEANDAVETYLKIYGSK